MSSILVVDDEIDLTSTYERLLSRIGYRVIPAGTRQQALDHLQSERLVLVVSDLRLPDGDGLDVVKAARAMAPAPPVIVATGFASETSRQKALQAGAAAYLSKPFAVTDFLDLVQRLLPSHA